LSGKFDATTTFDLEQHFGVLHQATLNRISFVPRHGETDQPVINLELGFSLPNADPVKNPPTASASLLLVAPYRQPTLGFVKHPDDPRRQLPAIGSRRSRKVAWAGLVSSVAERNLVRVL